MAAEVNFEALCAAAEALGADVGVAQAGGGHEIVITDFGRCRSARIPVTGTFDAAASVLCCSLALARELSGLSGEAVPLSQAWPELADLALVAAADG